MKITTFIRLTKHELGVSACSSLLLVIGNLYGSDRNRISGLNSIWHLLKSVEKEVHITSSRNLAELNVLHTHTHTHTHTHQHRHLCYNRRSSRFSQQPKKRYSKQIKNPNLCGPG